jgi:hypothetical protein
LGQSWQDSLEESKKTGVNTISYTLLKVYESYLLASSLLGAELAYSVISETIHLVLVSSFLQKRVGSGQAAVSRLGRDLFSSPSKRSPQEKVPTGFFWQ